MDPRDVGFGRLMGVAGAAGRRVADSTSAARQRVADAAGDAQERVKQSAEQVRSKVWSSRDRDHSPGLSALSVDISRADRYAADAERERIVLVAGLVFPESADQVVQATERLVITEENFASGRITTSQLETTTKDTAARAAAFGAPVAAVSLAGSVSGLGGAGITSGLAALGFGGLLGLSAMVTGIGTVVILGVAVHQGTRYLLATNERELSRPEVGG